MENITKQDVDFLLSPAAVRERAKRLWKRAERGEGYFKLHPEKLDSVADYVLKVIRDNYPDLKIPYHCRGGHLNAGGVDRIGQMVRALGAATPLEIAQAKIDLNVTSVLVDAGAGDKWSYKSVDGKTWSRSEGLAVASFDMFMAGAFSSAASGSAKEKLRADVIGMKTLEPATLARFFQVSDSNPLLGVDGRTHLLNELGRVMEKNPKIFVNGRIGDLLPYLIEKHGDDLKARHVLDFVLRIFGEIWPSRLRIEGQNMGDMWTHSGLGDKGTATALIPFHKLSQWLTYSLLVPMEEMGLKIGGVDELTGLAEYRNGGLMIDAGLIELKDPALAGAKHPPESELVIEWRALTVMLLDMLGDSIRKKLNMTADQLPLAKVLEGGTWHAGRRIAKEKRPGGEPPLNIVSDGTVF